MDVREWLGDNQLAIDIWSKKYKYENENFEEWLGRVSNGDEELARLIREKKFLFGGRILANRGLQHFGKKVTYSNCYVLAIEEDSIESIYQTCANLARTFSYGGGVGIDISPLRAKDMAVHNAAKTTTGAVSFMNTFSNVSEVIGQNGRRGALMISIDCHHPDLEEFIDIKNDLNAVTKANISVRITNDFMNAVINDRDWELSFETENGDKLVKTVKAKKLFRKLAYNNWNMAEPGILFWDHIENYNIISEDPEFHYAGVNPCAEEPLPNGGSCLLGSFNLSAYVDKNGIFDEIEFKKDIPVIVRAMNDLLDEGLPLHPLKVQQETVYDYRQIGIGVMGIADMLIKMQLKYDSEEAIKVCDQIGFILANESLRASAMLAKCSGAYPRYNSEAVLSSDFVIDNSDPDTYKLISEYGLRNSQILTIAPTGTLSTMLGISGGIEPIFSFSYTRKTQSLHGEDVFYKVFTPIAKEYMERYLILEEEGLPDFFVSAQTINPIMRVRMQGVWQNHIDASISSTVNLPNSATVEEVERLYIEAWNQGLKGMTIFRDGCARMGVLTLEPKKEEVKQTKVEKAKSQLNFGDTILVDDSVIGIKRKLKTGCGSLHCTFYFCPETGELREVFLDKGSSGGCLSLLNAMSRLSSLAARKGAPVEEIADQLQSVLVCPSYSIAKFKDPKAISKGSSCASAVANALLDAHKQFVEEFLEIDEDEIEIKTIQNNPPQIEDNNKMLVCPECGDRALAKTEGCMTCHSCGWSKCS